MSQLEFIEHDYDVLFVAALRPALIYYKLRWSYDTVIMKFKGIHTRTSAAKGAANSGKWSSQNETRSWMTPLVYLSSWSNGTAFTLTTKKSCLIEILNIKIRHFGGGAKKNPVWASMSVDIACQAFINTVACHGLGLELFCLLCTPDR